MIYRATPNLDLLYATLKEEELGFWTIPCSDFFLSSFLLRCVTPNCHIILISLCRRVHMDDRTFETIVSKGLLWKYTTIYV